jgi:hypothetical protein
MITDAKISSFFALNFVNSVSFTKCSAHFSFEVRTFHNVVRTFSIAGCAKFAVKNIKKKFNGTKGSKNLTVWYRLFMFY